MSEESIWSKLKSGAGKAKQKYDDYVRKKEEDAGRVCRTCGSHILFGNIVDKKRVSQGYTQSTSRGTDRNGNETFCTTTYSKENWLITTKCPQCGQLNTMSLNVSYETAHQTQNRFGAIIESGTGGSANADTMIMQYYNKLGNVLKAAKEVKARAKAAAEQNN